VNLVAHAPDRNSKNIGRPCSAPTTMDECVEDKFAFDLVDRMADKVRNDLIYGQSTSVHRILRCRVIGRSCNRWRGHFVLRSHAPAAKRLVRHPRRAPLVASKIWLPSSKCCLLRQSQTCRRRTRAPLPCSGARNQAARCKQCPLWVKSRHSHRKRSCPLYP